jgi:adenylate cyclase
MSFKPNGKLVPQDGDSIPLVREIVRIGRRVSCDISLQSPNVSGLHAELSFCEGYWRLRDLNSTNGTKVNGTRVQQKILRPGDQISIGKRNFTIVYEMPTEFAP